VRLREYGDRTPLADTVFDRLLEFFHSLHCAGYRDRPQHQHDPLRLDGDGVGSGDDVILAGIGDAVGGKHVDGLRVVAVEEITRLPGDAADGTAVDITDAVDKRAIHPDQGACDELIKTKRRRLPERIFDDIRKVLIHLARVDVGPREIVRLRISVIIYLLILRLLHIRSERPLHT